MKSPKEVWSQAAEVVSEMTLQERASLMSGSSFWHLQPIERLGFDAIMVADGPHGLRKAGPIECMETYGPIGSKGEVQPRPATRRESKD